MSGDRPCGAPDPHAVGAIFAAVHYGKLLITLGLEASSMLLALTMPVSTLTFVTGGAHMRHGCVYLVIFATLLLLGFQP